MILKGLIYVFDQNGITTPIKRTETIPDEHTFSFSASGNEILYLNALDGGNPSLKSKSISSDSETSLFEYTSSGSWNPLKSNNDFKILKPSTQDPVARLFLWPKVWGNMPNWWNWTLTLD